MEKKMFLKAGPEIFQRAEDLKKNLSHAEIILWNYYLRAKPLGYKFRRQHPISIYIADFYCHALKLIIEVNGKIHEKQEVLENDIIRQQNLEQDGITFLRFTNEEVERKLEDVIDKIESYIKANTPNP